MTTVATLTLFAMMLALGMTLRPADFRRLGSARTGVALGLLGQWVLLPAVGFALAWALALPPTQAVGLVLIAACPGGVVSNVFSRLAAGDVALSISLTAATSLVSFVTLPFVVGLGLRTFAADETRVALSFAEMATPLFTTTALPVLLGMVWLHARPAAAERLRGPLLGVSTGVLLLLIVGLAVGVAGQAESLSLGTLVRGAAPAVALLVASTMAIGWLAARVLRLAPAIQRTLALEIGLQNFNLALVVALSLLGEARYAGPALLYLPVMLGFAALVVAASRRGARSRPET